MPNNSFCTVGVAYGSRIAGTCTRSTPTCGADASLLSSPPAPGRLPAPCPDWFVSAREGPASASAPPSDGAGWVCAGGLPKSSQCCLPAPRACSIPPPAEAKHCAAVQTHARCGAELQAVQRHPGHKHFPIPRAPQARGVAPALCRGRCRVPRALQCPLQSPGTCCRGLGCLWSSDSALQREVRCLPGRTCPWQGRHSAAAVILPAPGRWCHGPCDGHSPGTRPGRAAGWAPGCQEGAGGMGTPRAPRAAPQPCPARCCPCGVLAEQPAGSLSSSPPGRLWMEAAGDAGLAGGEMSSRFNRSTGNAGAGRV